MKTQIVIAVALSSMMATAGETCEFFGIEFGKPSGLSTNELTMFEGEGWTEGRDANGARTRENYHRSRNWYCVRKDIALPASFFDLASITYSYQTIVPFYANYMGHFPKGASRRDCLKLMDAFAAELEAKCGIKLTSDGFGNRFEEEPKGFVPKDPPTGLKNFHDRYSPSCKFGSFFACYQGGRYPLHLNMQASENAFGERIVNLYVDANLANGAEKEGWIPVEEKEMPKADKTELDLQIEAKMWQRYGYMRALVFMKDCPRGTVVDKSIIGIKEIPSVGWGGRAYLEADVDAVVGRKVAEDRRRGDVIIKSDLAH